MDPESIFASKRNIIGFIIVVLLVLSIPLGVYLSRQRTQTKSRASATAKVFQYFVSSDGNKIYYRRCGNDTTSTTNSGISSCDALNESSIGGVSGMKDYGVLNLGNGKAVQYFLRSDGTTVQYRRCGADSYQPSGVLPGTCDRDFNNVTRNLSGITPDGAAKSYSIYNLGNNQAVELYISSNGEGLYYRKCDIVSDISNYIGLSCTGAPALSPVSGIFPDNKVGSYSVHNIGNGRAVQQMVSWDGTQLKYRQCASDTNSASGLSGCSSWAGPIGLPPGTVRSYSTLEIQDGTRGADLYCSIAYGGISPEVGRRYSGNLSYSSDVDSNLDASSRLITPFDGSVIFCKQGADCKNESNWIYATPPLMGPIDTFSSVGAQGIWEWYPTEAGTYQMFCRTRVPNVAECRGNPDSIPSGVNNVWECRGDHRAASITVQPATAPTTGDLRAPEGPSCNIPTGATTCKIMIGWVSNAAALQLKDNGAVINLMTGTGVNDNRYFDFSQGTHNLELIETSTGKVLDTETVTANGPPSADACAPSTGKPVDCACTSNSQCATNYCHVLATGSVCAIDPGQGGVLTPTISSVVCSGVQSNSNGSFVSINVYGSNFGSYSSGGSAKLTSGSTQASIKSWEQTVIQGELYSSSLAGGQSVPFTVTNSSNLTSSSSSCTVPNSPTTPPTAPPTTPPTAPPTASPSQPPANGGWTEWGSCSATQCGTQGTRIRTCTLQAPAACTGPNSEACSAPSCPVDNLDFIVDPTTKTVKIGDRFNLDIMILAQDRQVISADFRLNYDTTDLKYESFTPNSDLGFTVQPMTQSSRDPSGKGWVRYSATVGRNIPSGDIKLGTFTFTAKTDKAFNPGEISRPTSLELSDMQIGNNDENINLAPVLDSGTSRRKFTYTIENVNRTLFYKIVDDYSLKDKGDTDSALTSIVCPAVTASDDDLKNAGFKRYSSTGTDPIVRVSHKLSEADKTGSRNIFVIFCGNKGNKSIKHQTLNFKPNPVIKGVVCTYAPDGKNTLVTVKGTNFGTHDPDSEVGGLKVGGVSAVIKDGDWKAEDDWRISASDTTASPSPSASSVVGVYSTVKGIVPSLIKDKQPVELTLDDGRKVRSSCIVNTTSVTFQAKNVCIASGDNSATNVQVILTENVARARPIYNGKITLDKEGSPVGFTPTLEIGEDGNPKEYAIEIKVPKALQIKTEVKDLEPNETRDLGVLQVPVGDIAPQNNPDGAINSIDKSMLAAQWTLTSDVTKAADLNGDARVNSIDYSCLKLNFGKTSQKFVPSSQ